MPSSRLSTHPSHHHPTASNTDVPFLFLRTLFPSDSKELSPLPVLSMGSIQNKALTGETQIHQLLERGSLHKLRATSPRSPFSKGQDQQQDFAGALDAAAPCPC